MKVNVIGFKVAKWKEAVKKINVNCFDDEQYKDVYHSHYQQRLRIQVI